MAQNLDQAAANLADIAKNLSRTSYNTAQILRVLNATFPFKSSLYMPADTKLRQEGDRIENLEAVNDQLNKKIESKNPNAPSEWTVLLQKIKESKSMPESTKKLCIDDIQPFLIKINETTALIKALSTQYAALAEKMRSGGSVKAEDFFKLKTSIDNAVDHQVLRVLENDNLYNALYNRLNSSEKTGIIHPKDTQRIDLNTVSRSNR